MTKVCYNAVMTGTITSLRRLCAKLCVLLCFAGLVLMPTLPALCAPSGCGTDPAACATCPHCAEAADVQSASCCTLPNDATAQPEKQAAQNSGCCSTSELAEGWLAAHSCPCSMSTPTQPVQSARLAVEVQVRRAQDSSVALLHLLPAEPISALNVVQFPGAVTPAAPPKLAQLCRYRC